MKTIIEIPQSILTCKGYEKITAHIKSCEESFTSNHDYQDKLEWIIERVMHYANKTGVNPETILNSWEEKRTYWCMNYYQDANQPKIKNDNVKVFDTKTDLINSISKKQGFRCPKCAGVSSDAYECSQHECDWKVYGLFKDLGKGATVFIKEPAVITNIFMPLSWESGKEVGNV